ncbi:MAG: hypothetical protein FD131_3338 [Rhodocyclaceae bacterium]|nr:MAG: hypothetical protein FD131_3338 [Rhodocyclaceae bacterium]
MMPIVPVLNGLDLIRLRDVVLTSPVFGGTAGDYPWDRWMTAALQAGVPEDLANQGRSVFREAFQHDWPDQAKVECGWLDGGTTMILQALAFPEEAAARWNYLYSADNFGDAAYADEVTTDPMDIAEALEARGIKTAVFFGKGSA